MFGEIGYTRDMKQYVKKRGLGPDALALTWKEFENRMAGRKSSIKSALMDQKLLAGIGNVYSDEILFHARVHPQDRVDHLSERTLDRIYKMIRRVLNKTISYQANPRRVPKTWLLRRSRKRDPLPPLWQTATPADDQPALRLCLPELPTNES